MTRVKNYRVRRGPLTQEDMDHMSVLAKEGLTIQEIGFEVRRSQKTVKTFLLENKSHLDLSDVLVQSPEERKERARLRVKLRNREYFDELKNQLSKEELKYFTSTWINLLWQLKDNVRYSEEMQLKQLIMVDIMINRCMSERKLHVEDISKVQDLLDVEYAKDPSQQNSALLASLETQKSFARNSLTTYTAEYTKLLDKQKDINKDLKTTRDQRIKKIEDSKTSFTTFLKALDDEEVQDRHGREVQMVHMAKEKTKQEMSEYHTYIDGSIDQPLLTPETVKGDEEKEEAEIKNKEFKLRAGDGNEENN